ncbi:C40 family peptidase [Bacillus sp. V5-8f]|uniref:C40 family peptidase n=1 Tax=Bacillus sp. V5-8f TaxID=2053044 RepID=UPI000C762052|nr:NlpC/P60 family protein [Bacillus sp. V5-8f]PLT35778.1 endopeptidase [Bacillus sp. V5-8f]
MRKWIASTVVAAALLISPFQASANIGDQTLKPSMNHPDVRQLQNLLKVKGYYPVSGSYTTVYHTATTASVKKFQSAKKLKADGISGRTTFNALGVYKINNSTLISTAKKYMGTRYVWGGMSPSGFDCSGYINYVFRASQGITLPRTAADLYAKVGLKVSKPSVGDLVFFTTYKAGASHVGIYIGNGQFIHASSVKGVTVSSLSSPYYKARYLGAKTL